MTQHRDLAYGQRLPESWVDGIQEVLGTYVSPNFRLELANPTTLRVPAGTDNDQVGIMVDGRWRWITSNVTAAHPGGSAGTYDVYVTASDNDFIAGDPEDDETDYTFALTIKPQLTPPATPLFRKVATIEWNGSAITSISPTVGLYIPEGFITTFHIRDGTILLVDMGFDVGADASSVAGLLAAHVALTTAAHGGIVASSDSRLTNARTPTGAASGDLAGTYPSPKVAQASETFALTGDITPTQLSADQNNYNAGGSIGVAGVLRLDSSVNVNITGLTTGADGRLLVVRNIGAKIITLKNASTSSTAANRFLFQGDVALRPNEAVTLQYDTALSRWMLATPATNVLDFAGCVLHTVNNQTVTSSSPTYNGNPKTVKVVWEAEDRDTNGFHTGSDDFVAVPSGLDGTYDIESFIALTGGATDSWAGIEVNGVVIAVGANEHSDQNFENPAGPNDIIRVRAPSVQLAAGDVVRVLVKRSASESGTLTFAGSASGSTLKTTRLWMRRVAV